MVPRDLVALAAVQRRPLNDIHSRTIVPLHIEVDRDEVLRPAIVEITRDRKRLEKDFGHDHGAAEVEDDTAVIQVGARCGEAAEIAMARVADRRAVCCWMLMND